MTASSQKKTNLILKNSIYEPTLHHENCQVRKLWTKAVRLGTMPERYNTRLKWSSSLGSKQCAPSIDHVASASRRPSSLRPEALTILRR